jgi:hypothetical protein
MSVQTTRFNPNVQAIVIYTGRFHVYDDVGGGKIGFQSGLDFVGDCVRLQHRQTTVELEMKFNELCET